MQHKYLSNVVSLKVNIDKCISCLMCINVCPHEVFSIHKQKIQIIERDNCMECGACARNCPTNCIDVNSGVGCAYAIIVGKLTGTEPNCGCGEENNCG